MGRKPLIISPVPVSMATASAGRFPLWCCSICDCQKFPASKYWNGIRGRPDLNEVTVVVLTGSENVPDVSKAHELGADSYLVKPGEFRELVAMVERIQGHWLMLLTTPDQPT